MSYVDISQARGDYLLRLRGCRDENVSRGEDDFEAALEAYERGWREGKTAKDEVGSVCFMHIFGLSAAGHAVADAYEKALHDAQPKVRAKRAGLWFVRLLSGWLQFIIGSLVGAIITLLVQRFLGDFWTS